MIIKQNTQLTIETHIQEGPPHSWEKSWDENVTEAFIEFAQWQATNKKSFRKQRVHDWRRLWSKYSVTQVWTQTRWINYNSFHLFVQLLWICYLCEWLGFFVVYILLLCCWILFFKSNLKWGVTLNSKSSSNGQGKWVGVQWWAKWRIRVKWQPNCCLCSYYTWSRNCCVNDCSVNPAPTSSSPFRYWRKSSLHTV